MKSRQESRKKKRKYSLIMSHYSILFSSLHSISCSPSVHLSTGLVFAVIPLLIVDEAAEDSAPVGNPTVSPALHGSFMSSSL